MPNVSRSTFVLAATAFLALAACGGSSSSSSSTPQERILFTDRLNVHLATFDGTHLTTVAAAAVPSAGLLNGHTIFSVIKHPSQPWLFVTSFNECWSGGAWCWGNARIDRFTIGQNTITWSAKVFDFTLADTRLSCTTYTSSNVGQSGSCAPVNGTFSASGNRLYVQDDSQDNLLIFGFEPSNALTLLAVASTGGTYLHGVATDPDGVSTYVYNGSYAYTVGGDVPLPQNPSNGRGGNSTRWIARTGADWLLTTDDTNRIAMYSLSNPADPVVITSLTVTASGSPARALDLNAGLNRVVLVGQNSVKTFAFTGTAFTPEASFDPHVGSTAIENREVSFFSNDSKAAVAYFQRAPGTPSGFTGGLSIYGIDPAGAITTVSTLPLPGEARAVKALRL